MTKFDIINKTEATVDLPAVGLTAHTEGGPGAISGLTDFAGLGGGGFDFGGDGIPSSPSLSTDEILQYCASQLNKLDQEIKDEQEKANSGGDGHGSSSDGNGSSGGDHPPGWPFTATVSDVHHAGAGVAGDAITSAEMDMLDLQSLVSARSEAVQLTTQIMQGLDDAEKSIINNIGGGDGHGTPESAMSTDAGSALHDGITDKTSDSTFDFHGDGLTGHAPVAAVHLPDLAAPDLNGFLNDHGIDVGNDGSDGPLGQINLGGSDDNQGPMSGLPSPTGGNDSTDIPGGVDLSPGGISGVGVPKGIDFGDDGPLTGVGVPKGINIGDDPLSGVGVPGEIGNHGGITGPGVPGGSGHVGVGGFTADDFFNGELTDSPHGGGGHSRHGTVGSDSRGVSTGSSQETSDSIVSTAANSGGGETTSDPIGTLYDDGDAKMQTANQSNDTWGRFVGAAEITAGVLLDTATLLLGRQPAVEETINRVDDPKPDPDKPDPGKGNQPVDDSGTGAHPSTHGTEQPVDDSGTSPAHPGTHGAEQPVDDSGAGPVHPLTGATAQPVDDSGTGPAHPGTHLGAVATDAPTVGSTNLATASFGGHSAAFWDAAAHSIADSQHATAATTAAAPVADASALVAHNDSFGIFQHSAATSFAASAPVADSHANMDALATTHIETSHVDSEPSHSLGASLDLSHLALHM
jgi:hypothetical protein